MIAIEWRGWRSWLGMAICGLFVVVGFRKLHGVVALGMAWYWAAVGGAEMLVGPTLLFRRTRDLAANLAIAALIGAAVVTTYLMLTAKSPGCRCLGPELLSNPYSLILQGLVISGLALLRTHDGGDFKLLRCV